MKSPEARRDLIERTALRLFAEHGPTDVSTRDIAQACGIGESALYRHMSSKEELALRVFRNAYIDFGKEMSASCREEAPLREKLAAYLRIMLTAYDQDPVLVQFLLGNQHRILRRAILETDITPVTVMLEAISLAMAREEIPQAPETLLTAMAMGAALQPLTFARFGRLPGAAIEHLPHLLDGLCRLLQLEIR